MSTDYPAYVAGRARETGRWLPVLDKYQGGEVARVALPAEEALRTAVWAAKGRVGRCGR